MTYEIPARSGPSPKTMIHPGGAPRPAWIASIGTLMAH